MLGFGIWRKIIKIIGIIILAIILGLVILFMTAPKSYNILIIGSDQRGTERARSDVMFIVSLPKTGSKDPVFLSIPRDTKVDDKEFGLQKMTHFYALGDRTDDGRKLGNRDLTKKQIEKLTDIKVNATVEVTFDSFQEIIDSVGGVNLGTKQVDGEAALKQIRDRFTDGRSDFDRQGDEREVFRGLLTKVKSPTKAKALYDYFDGSDKARLTFNKTSLAHFLYGAGIARFGNIKVGTMKELEVPGHSERVYTPAFNKSLYYWIADEPELKKIVDENF